MRRWSAGVLSVLALLVRFGAGPGMPLAPKRLPQDADFEVDANDMYVMPGILDVHVHIGGPPKNPEAKYVYKLSMAHGVATVRGVSLTSHAMSVSERDRSARVTVGSHAPTWAPAAGRE